MRPSDPTLTPAGGPPITVADLAATWRAVAGTSARGQKTALIAAALRKAGPGAASVVVHWLAGELPQRQIGVGYAALRASPPPASAPSLTVAEVDAAFTRIKQVSGPGSVATRRELLHGVFGRATSEEQGFLVHLLAGELRQGALEGVMVDAIAKAAEVPLAAVRRAVMLRGALGPVAEAALAGGAAALSGFTLEVGRPVRPMLASSAPDVAAGLAGEMGVEWKMDGIRAQVHVRGDDVRIFTRTLDDITVRVPEVADAARALNLDAAVLDAEVIALRPDGSPETFQVTASNTSQGSLRPFFFDVLHLAGSDLLDEPAGVRHEALSEAVPEAARMPRLVTASPDEASAFFADAVARGHEGVVLKSLTAPYAAGRRGAGWVKVKPRHTLDLVVLAVEWGHGRRAGKLSNLHLGARDAGSGEFVMLGKTFKGLTDALLDWQTERFLSLKLSDDGFVVKVEPVQVVEVAFDGLQRSTRYPGGLALRFARVLRYRADKSAAEADTFQTVRALAGAPPPVG
ncbi:ATP-dependent DNA ligase [Actinocorallia aurea]